MLLSKVFLAGLLVLCINFGLSSGQNGTSAAPPQAPPIGKGFFKYLFNGLKNRYLGNRQANSDAFNTLSRKVNTTLTAISSDIRAFGGQIKKLSSEVRSLFSLGNSTDLINNALTFAVTATSISAGLLETANVAQKGLNDCYQGFHSVLDSIIEIIFRNVDYTNFMVTFVPNEIGKKLIIVYNKLKEIFDTITKIVLALKSQIDMMVMRGAISILKDALPIQELFNNIFNQIKAVVDKILEAVNNLRTTLVNIFTNIKNTTENAIKSALSLIQRQLQGLLSEINSIKDKIVQTLSGGKNNASPAPTDNASPAPTTASETTTILLISTSTVGVTSTTVS